MDRRDIVKALARDFSVDQLITFFRLMAPTFRREDVSFDHLIREDWPFDTARQLGVIELPEEQTVFVGAIHVQRELTSRSSKKTQYELGKRILKAGNHNAGIFAFFDDNGRFRLSLITVTYHGTRRRFSTFRRHTFFVDPDLPNKTFINQIGRADFSRLENILEAFSLEAVSDAFYQEFKPRYDALADAVQGTRDEQLKQDFALLFVIRVIFLGFVQKKGWLGGDPRFLQNFWKEYENSSHSANTFYKEWLEPLFFEALNSPPGRKVSYGRAPFSEETQTALQMAPYLNGELFKRKQGIDDQGLWIPDNLIGEFFDFLFQYNFTVEENELYDEELELNPEFLGIIFERLTNMEQGAVYTPRVEVDMMCRLALVKWLERTTEIPRGILYQLFFPAEHPGEVALTPEQIRTLIARLESVTVCDPAAGSGAFEVGMLQVLDQLLEDLYSREETPEDLRQRAPTPFERKKTIIERSLYGVEVKRWAVWINHLRLWLTLFVDMPDDFQQSYEPLLPNLTFKVRVGDSLVQRIGDKIFPVHGHADLSPAIKRRITRLKQKKRDFFYNRVGDYALIEKEELDLFRAVLDAEIEARRREIQELSRPPEKKLFDLESTVPDEVNAQAREERMRQLKREIAELEEQKRSLRDERPFIWSIEFAEIFFDRGGFDIVIGNPPYVRQEEISDPNHKLSDKEYKQALKNMVLLDFPDHFALSRAETHRFKKNRKPSGRSDLYTYFYIRSLRLLNERGVHVFICSNAWLDVGYGAWLQEFFLRRAPLFLVIDNHARRSFAQADINTVITVSGAPFHGDSEIPKDHVVRFVAFKKPFEEVVHADNFITIENARKTLKTPDFRVFPITVGELLQEGSEPSPMGPGKYVGDKWGGKYLRAPDIFFTILEKGRGKLVRLGEIAEIRRGITTGADGWFYVKPLSTKGKFTEVVSGDGSTHLIETNFLVPIIRSAKECPKYRISIQDLDFRIVVIDLPRSQIPKYEAWKYVKYGERVNFPSRTGGGIPAQRPTCASRGDEWYRLNRESPDEIIGFIFKIYRDRFVVALNNGALGDDALYEIRTKESILIYLMNSTLFILFLEIYGQVPGGGGGPLAIMVSDAKRLPVLNPVYLTKEQQLIVREVFMQMGNREVKNIFEEIGIRVSNSGRTETDPNPLPDRKALDDIVFDALGLTEEERKEVYRAVAQLVWERISKAKSVKSRRRASSKKR